MDAAEYSLAVHDCLAQSWWLRRLGPDGSWLLRQAVALVEMEPALDQADLRQLKARLRARLYRRPVSRLRRTVLNHLAVPLVADLVFQWWLGHKTRSNGRSGWAP